MAHRPDYESADYKEGYEDGKREASKEWQSLSDWDYVEIYGHASLVDWRVVRAIEANLKEKNG